MTDIAAAMLSDERGRTMGASEEMSAARSEVWCARSAE
jgi:hypothetical protein